MSTPKEIFLELIRPDGQPERQLRQYEALHMCLTDPCNTYLRGNRKRGTTSRDRWGTTILFPEDAPGPMPDTREGLAVCPDITRWRETVHAPDLEAACTEGWEACRAEARAACGPDHLLAGFMGTGIFEQCHFLMGFEDTLTNLYAHPDEMHALIDYITEYRLTYVRMLIDNLQPDVIFSHDDWGTKNALFMKPEMWREFFKEPYRRFYGYIRSRGVIAIHHADSYLVPIVDDMAEIGIQVWQGVLPENDIPALQRHLNGRLTLMGGFGAAIDRKDAAPEEILTYARDVLRRDCPGGHFIPGDDDAGAVAAEHGVRGVVQIRRRVVIDGRQHSVLVRAGRITPEGTEQPPPALGVGGHLPGIVSQGGHRHRAGERRLLPHRLRRRQLRPHLLEVRHGPAYLLGGAVTLVLLIILIFKMRRDAKSLP